MYEVYNSAVPEQINELFPKSESTHHYPTRYASNNNFLVNFTIYSGAKRWNELARPIKGDRSGHLKALKQS